VFEPDPQAHFGPGESDGLLAYLTDTEANTATAEVSTGTELELTPAGEFRCGLRPTRPAFGQICDSVSPGLYALVSSLLSRPDAESHAAARACYNRVLSVSRGVLVGGLVLFHRSGRADAFVSHRYRPFTNLTAVRTLVETLPGWAMYHGQVDGRWVTARFAAPAAEGAERDGVAWRPAVSLLNNEAGRGAVKVAGGVLRPAGGLSACGDPRRATHAHAAVAHAVGEALLTVRDEATSKVALAARWADRLAYSRLGLGQVDPHDEAETERRLLVALRPTGAAARGILLWAKKWPAYARRPTLESCLKLLDLQRASWADVWAAVCRRARRSPPRRRFELESFAWRLLQGRPRATEYTWPPPPPPPPPTP
jgi:hypothetical protein